MEDSTDMDSILEDIPYLWYESPLTYEDLHQNDWYETFDRMGEKDLQIFHSSLPFGRTRLFLEEYLIHKHIPLGVFTINEERFKYRIRSIKPYRDFTADHCKILKIHLTSNYTVNDGYFRQIFEWLFHHFARHFENTDTLDVETTNLAMPMDLIRIFNFVYSFPQIRSVYLNLHFVYSHMNSVIGLKIWKRHDKKKWTDEIQFAMHQFIRARREVTFFYYQNKTRQQFRRIFTAVNA